MIQDGSEHIVDRDMSEEVSRKAGRVCGGSSVGGLPVPMNIGKQVGDFRYTV